MTVRESVPKAFGPEKKPIFLKVPFVGDKAASFVRRSLRECLSIFPAARPLVIFETRRIPVASPKDRLFVLHKHTVIYSFACTCGCQYVGRTERRLGDRILQHVQKYIYSGAQGRTQELSLGVAKLINILLRRILQKI